MNWSVDTVKKLKPKGVTIVEQEVNHNGPVFLNIKDA